MSFLYGETIYFNKLWTWRHDSYTPNAGNYCKNIFLDKTRIVTKVRAADETSSADAHREYFYHGDHLQSATLITDYEGSVYERINYTPYGELWLEKSDNNGEKYLPYRFTGKELDSETGLYYYGARYLDPKYSRWLSTDPALGEYIPQAPISDEATKHNQNLPGMGGLFNPINGSLYHYTGNNPVHYIDPDGKSPVHFSPSLGWSHHAPQRVFGYFNIYDPASMALGFNINGTRIDGNDFTVRMWKGCYSLAGAGCELGIYTLNGASMSRGELSKLGIISSSSELYSEFNEGFLLGTSKEDKPSFWTTQFHPLMAAFGLKDKLTANFQLNFDTEEHAENFFNQISDKKKDAKEYFWNGLFKKENVDFYLSDDKKSIVFKYGDLDK